MRWLWPALAFGAGWVAGCRQPSPFCGPTRVLTLAANLDDDDADGVIDGLALRPSVRDDEVASVEVQIAAGCEGALQFSSVPVGEVRVFAKRAGAWEALAEGAAVTAGRHELGFEVVRGRSPDWNGRGSIRVGLGNEVVIDAAPFQLAHVDEQPREVWVVAVEGEDFAPTSALVDALQAELSGALVVRVLPGPKVRADRWVQDAFQAGHVLGKPVLLRLPRGGRNRGLSLLTHADGLGNVGLLSTGALSDSPFDFGGNLEVLAPYEGFPRGRILLGGDLPTADDPVHATLRSWLEAQGAQGPAIRLPTHWLESKHVDELVAPLPSRGGRIRVAMPSASLGVEAARGAHVELTDDSRRFNEVCQRHLDAAEAELRRQVAPQTIDVLHLPVLFASRDAGAATVMPNPVNALVLADRVLLGAPDAGVLGRALAEAAGGQFEDAGFAVRWLDVSAYASRGGSVHCAVEVVRTPR